MLPVNGAAWGLKQPACCAAGWACVQCGGRNGAGAESCVPRAATRNAPEVVLGRRDRIQPCSPAPGACTHPWPS